MPDKNDNECKTIHAEVDAVTTLMLHGIPCRTKIHQLLQVFAEVGFPEDSFDYLYMPHRGNSGKRVRNKGYMFLNCSTPDVARQFRKTLEGCPLGSGDGADCKSTPVYCTSANIQGCEANVVHLVSTNKDQMAFALVRNGAAWATVRASRT